MDKKYYISVFLISLVLFFAGLMYGLEKNKSVNRNSVETVDVSGGFYIRLVFIGSSNCKYANNEETHRAISYIKKKLNSVLEKTAVNFISTGISHDISSSVGIKYLEKTGPYNELLVGGGPLNLGIMNYTSSGSSTPRVLLFLENYKTEVFGMNINNFHDSQELLKSYTGLYEILDLYEFLDNSSDEQIVNHFGLD